MTENGTPAIQKRPSASPRAASQAGLDGTPSHPGDCVSFGPFRLFPAARALEHNGRPLALGNRALDILTVLVERAGEVVSHRELIARAWRGLVVDPSNLRVHMTALRRALGDQESKNSYITNVTGQGYSFVAPIVRELGAVTRAPTAAYPCGSSRQRLVLPPMLARMVGRDELVRTIVADVIAERFVTIIGPGGMGKTTAAVAVAHAMLEEFTDAVCFVDLGTVSDSSLVAATVASSLGLTIQTGDVVPTLLECLRTLRILLVLDNCEHVVDAAATLAEVTFREATGVHILATSREALRVEGEHAYWLPPLASPPPNSRLEAAEVLKFPAVKLFMERASAAGGRFELNDLSAPIVASICGRLDGIPLAIELVAGRVGSHGIEGTEELLNRNLGLDWQGRRTALPRHQTMRALLDWSYGFLTPAEQIALRRLATFVGPFSVEDAQAIAGTSPLTELHVATTIDSLVAKSLIDVTTDGGVTLYRLLETTRVYAQEKLQESGGASEVAERHARYFSVRLAATFGQYVESPSQGAVRSAASRLGNVRAALAWCFAGSKVTPTQDKQATAGTATRIKLGVELAAAAVPVFLELSLLRECHHWADVALASMDDLTLGSQFELILQEARAISSTWARGNGEDVRVALTRGISLATALGDEARRLRLLVGMHIYLIRIGAFRASLAVAEELQHALHSGVDPLFATVSDWVRGSSEHFIGNQAAARQHFEAGFARGNPGRMQLSGLDYRIRAMVTFARVAWLNGSPDRASALAQAATEEAAQASKPLNVCFSLLYSSPVYLWCGDLERAQHALDQLIVHPNWNALPSLHATGRALRGELLIRQGDTQGGIALLRDALSSMRADRQTLFFSRAACELAECLIGLGHTDEALDLIDETTHRTNKDELLELPELLRLRAKRSLSMPWPDSSEAEELLCQSIECARLQSAKSWELRAAQALAELYARQGRRANARRLLAPIYDQFTEGFDTADLRSCKTFLLTLDGA